MVALDSMRVVSSAKKDASDGVNQINRPSFDSQVGVSGETHTDGFINASDTQSFGESCEFKSERDCLNSSHQRRCSLLATTNNTDNKTCKSEMDCVNSSHQRRCSLLVTTNNADSKICRRGSLQEARRSSLLGGRRGSMEMIALLDRISGISLCDQEFQLHGNHAPNPYSTNAIEISGARWSNLSNHRGESMHSLAGVDLSQETFLRDQELYNCDIENSLFEFQAEFDSQVSIKGYQ
jgi:hypothetical protein